MLQSQVHLQHKIMSSAPLLASSTPAQRPERNLDQASKYSSYYLISFQETFGLTVLRHG